MISDTRIRELIDKEEIGINGLESLDNQLQASTLDLRVASDYERPATGEVFSAEANNGQIILKPDTFYRLHTMEEVTLSNSVHGNTEEVMTHALDGIRVATGAIHPGYSNYLVLGVENRSEKSKILKPSDTIVQVTFHMLEGTVEQEYKGEPEQF